MGDLYGSIALAIRGVMTWPEFILAVALVALMAGAGLYVVWCAVGAVVPAVRRALDDLPDVPPCDI